MSAADPVTQDRVYRALKANYLGGAFESGARLDIQSLADRYRASKTPVREAVHRLFGENLVEADPGGGFRICVLTTPILIQLYAWNCHLLVGLAHLLKPSQLTAALDRFQSSTLPDEPTRIARRAGAIFLALAEGTGNSEAIAAIEHLNERLFYRRVAEAADPVEASRELRVLTNTDVADVQKNVRRRIEAYHERRIGHLHRLARG